MIYPNKLKPIQYINKTPYLISGVFAIDQVKDINAIKQWLEVDTAFKNVNQGVYYFCTAIEEASCEEIK